MGQAVADRQSDPAVDPGRKLTQGVLVWAAVAAGAIVGLWHYFRWMWYGWFPAWKQGELSVIDRLLEGDSYYTHGPLIPVVSFAIVALLVKHTKVTIRRNYLLGAPIILLSAVAYLLACSAQVRFVLGFVALLMLVGVIVMFWGAGALRRFWFPLAFMAFALPLSHVTIAGLSFRLRMIATDWAVGLTNILGVPAERLNNTVFLAGDKSMVVGDVCSGLRTLISLLAFGALYAYVCKLRGLWRVALFLMAVPVGLVCNCIRISSIMIVAHYGNVEFATGVYHDSSGVLVFILAFLVMFGLERAVLAVRAAVGMPAKVVPMFHDVRREDEGASRDSWRRMAAAPGSKVGVITAAVILATSLWGWRLARKESFHWNAEMVHAAIPAGVVVDGRPYVGERLLLPDRILRILRTEDYFYRRYRSEANDLIDAMVIYSQDNRMTTHAPEVCITAAGETIVDGRNVRVSGVPDRGEVPCKRLTVRTDHGYICYLYTLRAGRTYTANIWKQQWTILFNGLIGRDASGSLVRLSTHADGRNLDEAFEKLDGLMRTVIPHLDAVLAGANERDGS